MSRHEIDIEGLPKGWEPVRIGYPKAGEDILEPNGAITQATTDWESIYGLCLIIRRKVRKYDWSKTLPDVLVQMKDATGYHPHAEARRCRRFMIVPVIWQPNIHGKCPVDGEASVVRVLYASSVESRETIASKIRWGLGYGTETVLAWHFIRLADGYEW